MIFSDNGGNEARRGEKAVHPPAAALARSVLDAEDLRRLIRRERYIEGRERMAEAIAERFDERFLTRPAIEESEWSQKRIESRIRLVLRVPTKRRIQRDRRSARH